MFDKIRSLFRNRWYPVNQTPEAFFATAPAKLPGTITGPEQALTLSPLWAACRLYSTLVGSFPLVTYRQTGQGRERATTHPAYPLLMTRPNPAQSRAVFWRFVMAQLFLHGNAFIICRWRNNGNLMALYPQQTQSLARAVVDSEWNRVYWFREADGTIGEYGDKDVIHLQSSYSKDGLQGEPIWRYAGESLGLHRQVLESATSFFANAARPSLYVRYPGKLDPQALATFKEGFKDSFQGTANTGKVPVIDNGGEVNPLMSGTAEDAQIVEGLAASVGDIARWSGLSPIQLGDFSAAHYNSLSADNTYLYQRSLRPELDAIEQELNCKLFVDGSTFAEFDTDEVLRGDPLSTAQLANIGIQGGWLLRSEAREWFGLPPKEGLDQPTTPINMGGVPMTNSKESSGNTNLATAV